MSSKTTNFGTLCNYKTGEVIRPATKDEAAASRAAAERDGGAGVIEVDDVSCYVEDGNEDDDMTAEERHGQWTVVDTSGQRFWPEPAAHSAREALAAANANRGTWHQ